jgi:hypothetical protein
MKVNQHFEEIYRLYLQGWRVSFTDYSSAIKMEAIFSSVDFHRATWIYIPEGRHDHNYSCENLEICMLVGNSASFNDVEDLETCLIIFIEECGKN